MAMKIFFKKRNCVFSFQMSDWFKFIPLVNLRVLTVWHYWMSHLSITGILFTVADYWQWWKLSIFWIEKENTASVHNLIVIAILFTFLKEICRTCGGEGIQDGFPTHWSLPIPLTVIPTLHFIVASYKNVPLVHYLTFLEF